jgi:hypothetical protein
VLTRILDEMKASNGPLDFAELSRRVGVERSALEGMLMQLVRLGKLREISSAPVDCTRCAGCAGACTATQEGAVYALVEDEA